MKHKWIIFWAIAFLPLILTLILYPHTPSIIPLHWNEQGLPDSWSPKFPNLFLLPITVLLFSGIASLLPHFGEKSDQDPGRLYSVCIFIMVILGVALAVTYVLLAFNKGLNSLI